MTYLLFINGVFFDSTRQNAQAFAWLRGWRDKGHEAGLKFVPDGCKEVFKWLVPPDVCREQMAA